MPCSMARADFRKRRPGPISSFDDAGFETAVGAFDMRRVDRRTRGTRPSFHVISLSGGSRCGSILTGSNSDARGAMLS